MTDFPDLKIKALVSFPAAVFGGTGIAVRQENGQFYFDLAFDELAQITTIPAPAVPTTFLALWEQTQNTYRRMSIPDLQTQIGGGGGLPEAPNDGLQYGRQSLGWTQIAGGGGGIPEAPSDGTIYGRRNAAWAAAGTVTNIATAGLATGGPITSGGTVTVPAATPGQAVAGIASNLAVTPQGLSSAMGYGYFHVDRNGVNQTTTAGAYNRVNWTRKVVDPYSFFDNVTNFRYQPTQAGYYFIYAAIRENPATALGCQVVIRKNGVAAFNGCEVPVAGDSYSQIGGLVFLNGTTDYVDAAAFTTTVTLGGATADTFLFGWRVN